jgi:error-prone DNA polymerase
VCTFAIAPADSTGTSASFKIADFTAGFFISRTRSASGITFLNLEDETGLVNVICSVGLWSRYRRTVRESRALIVRGTLERSAEGVVNIVADRVEQLPLRVTMPSRDFR